MTRIAYFGHDVHDAAIRRRAEAFLSDGFEVDGYMMRRGEPVIAGWIAADLGETRDGAFLQRIQQVFRGSRIAAETADRLRAADVILARNLDMLACAFLARRKLGLDTPVIYECLDVHRLLVRNDPAGMSLRALEGALLKRCAALVVSSPAFVREHFEPRHGGHPRTFLLENRLVAGMDYGPRPGKTSHGDKATGPFRLGWFGILRCSRSLDLLISVADALGDAVEIMIRGRVSRVEIPDFETRIAGRANIRFGGAYRAPEDLRGLYAGVDAVWAGDFMEAGYNSVWLLPNRLYEGGYYGVPPIAPAGTETARWALARDGGFAVDEPLEETLPALVRYLTEHRDVLAQKRACLLDQPVETFVQPSGTMHAVIGEAMERPETGFGVRETA